MVDITQFAVNQMIGQMKHVNRNLAIWMSNLKPLYSFNFVAVFVDSQRFTLFFPVFVTMSIHRKPQIKYLSGMLPGPFVSKPRFNSMAMGDEVQFSSTCVPFPGQEPKVVRVQCPPMKCGIRKKVEFDAPKLRIRDKDDKDKRDKRDETLRIVGGDRSLPHEWPFIVAIYKNGRFHCGGTIHTADWVRSPHCQEKDSVY